MNSLPAVVAAVARVIALQGAVPYACFGHSLGALLAFEVARYKQQHGLAPARQLFVSGSAAPAARTGLAKLHLLPDAELIDALRSYNGTPAELLANRELMSLVLPTVRADFSLVENYAYRPSLRLPSPLTVLAGRGDEHVEPHLLESWRKETAGECRIEWFDGDHFFLDSQRDAVLECVATVLEQLEGLDLECGAQRMAN